MLKMKVFNPEIKINPEISKPWYLLKTYGYLNSLHVLNFEHVHFTT